MTRRLLTAVPVLVPAAVLVGQLLLLSACTGDEPPPAPSPSATSSAPGGSPSPSGTPTATPAPGEQALLDRVRDDGTLSVIVEVTLDGEAGPGTTEGRRLIAAAQDDLVAQLDPAHAQVTTRFQRNPQMTFTVDEDGLHALFASPRVARVWPNETVRLD